MCRSETIWENCKCEIYLINKTEIYLGPFNYLSLSNSSQDLQLLNSVFMLIFGLRDDAFFLRNINNVKENLV